MANDYIVRLQGQDNLSGTIKNVQRSISQLTGDADKLNKIQERFNRIDQSSAPLKKKLRDVKQEMEKLAIAGDTSSELFQKMAKAAQKYQQALDQVNSSTKNVTNSSNMMNGKLGNLKNIANDIASKSGFGGIASQLGALVTPAGAATAAVAAVGVVMVNAAKAANEFETHLDSLQSLTGLSDEAMKDISKGAVEMSKEFRSSASEIVDAMKLIGSQAPELLSNKDALMEVTKAANVLAEAAQIEVVDAAKGITTVMNQMGVSASEATNIINVLAASSQQGSADVAYLNKAFEKAGTAAKGAGMSYVELSAAIESIAPKFSSADVSGSQLASTLLKLSMQGNNDFKPAVVGMQQALENLSKAELDDAAIKDLVGESNVTMLKSLIEAKDTFAGYTQSLANTNTAYEQMAINNDNFEGATIKLKSAWDALMITLGQSGIMQGIIDQVMDIMGLLNDIINVISDVISAFDLFGDGTVENCNIAKKQIELVSEVIKGIGVVLQIVVAVVAKAFNAIKDVATNVANGIANKWSELKAKLTDNAFVKNISAAWTAIYNKAVEIIGRLKKLWNDFLAWLGLESKSSSTPAQISNDVAVPAGTTAETTSTTTGGGGGSGSGSGKGKGKGGGSSRSSRSTTTKEKPEENSVRYWEELINAEKTYRQTHNLTSEQIAASNKKLEDYNKKLDEVKKALETPKQLSYLEEVEQSIKDAQKALRELNPNDADFEAKALELQVKLKGAKDAKEKFLQEIGEVEIKPQAKEGSTAWIGQQIAEKQAAIKLEVVGSDEWKQLSKEIADLTDQQHTIELKVNSESVKTQFEIAAEAAEAYQARMEATYSTISNVGSAFSSLGGAIGGTAGKMMEMAGQTAQAVSQIIPQIVALIGAKEGEALASGTASAAGLPFPANIAAIASIIATITALFAGFAGKFADGGIVGGGSFHGDNLIARVNAGEMILNQRQQSNLFRTLDSGGATGGMRNVEFTISGSTLKGCLKNYDSKMSKLK